jgi:hypothetical protein
MHGHEDQHAATTACFGVCQSVGSYDKLAVYHKAVLLAQPTRDAMCGTRACV